ncbi:MAG TPA: polyamine aminopropyltransferase [Clostridia bacterium]|nr:polyamine aminopropyltransferase [Clostridia bacterium]
MEGLWFTEKQDKGLAIGCEVLKTLHSETTPYQKIAVYDTVQFGRMLTLDGIIQTTINDEFFYHEMITHVPLTTHPKPRKVLVIGGGDGGTIREIVKHKFVEEATLVEIDRRVVEVSKEYLPEISCALEHPKVEVLFKDGIKHIEDHKNFYDVVIVDSTDPIGPAVGLFSKEFYRAVFGALREDGLFVAQTESPFFDKDFVSRVYRDIGDVFPIARLYLSVVPTYPGGFWGFTMGSNVHDPANYDRKRAQDLKTRYYSPDIHEKALALPPFVQDLVNL